MNNNPTFKISRHLNFLFNIFNSSRASLRRHNWSTLFCQFTHLDNILEIVDVYNKIVYKKVHNNNSLLYLPDEKNKSSKTGKF